MYVYGVYVMNVCGMCGVYVWCVHVCGVCGLTWCVYVRAHPSGACGRSVGAMAWARGLVMTGVASPHHLWTLRL